MEETHPEQSPVDARLPSMTKGMQEVLDSVQARAEDQYNRLNATREALRTLRTELVATISELNSRKRELRVSLKEIVDLKDEISRLNAETELEQRFKLKKMVFDGKLEI